MLRLKLYFTLFYFFYLCLQCVDEKGKKAIQDCETHLSHIQQEVEGILGSVELQTSKDDATLQEDTETLSSINTQTLDTVHNFISSELRQDLPTGMREAVYSVLSFVTAQVKIICPCIQGCNVTCILQERPLSVGSMCTHVC